MSIFGGIGYSTHIYNLNKFNNDRHSRSFKKMAKINQVIVKVEEQFAMPELGIIGDTEKEQIASSLSSKTNVAIVKNILSTGFTRDGNPLHFYIIMFPFSDTPEKGILMTNQCWLPIDISGRKTMEVEVLKEENDPIFGQRTCYKEVDFYKEFSKEDILKGLCDE